MKTNILKTIRKAKKDGFNMALEGVNLTWGVLIQNLSAELELTDEQTQKLSRIAEKYKETMCGFVKEQMPVEEFAEYMVEKSKQIIEELKTRWS